MTKDKLSICKGWCKMGLFDAPSGAKFCWVNDKYWKGSYDDSQQKCLDLGFTGLMEARDTEDARYAHVMNMCKCVDHSVKISRFFCPSHFT